MRWEHPARLFGPDTGAEGGTSPEPTPDADRTGSFDLSAVRNLILQAHPDTVPELVAGANFDELMGSVEVAKAAYQRIVDATRAARTASAATAPKIPAGGSQRQLTPNVEELSPAAKISEGLRRRQRRS